MKTRKNIWLWASYDFANSILSIVFLLYFAQWAVIDRGISDFSFNITFTIAAVLLLFTVPITGSVLDKHMRRISGLRYSTIFTAIFYGLCSISAINNYNLLALVFFTLATYVYLLSFTFYTPLIQDISSKDKVGFVSGLGIALNYLGQFCGLLVVLPFANGLINLFGGTARAETLLPATVIFFILSLPMLIFFDEPKKKKVKFILSKKIKETFLETKILFSVKSVLFFMIAYFFFNNAVLTASYNFPLFMEQVWHVSDNVKSLLLAGIVLTSAIGGLLSGLIADKIGHKKTLIWILVGWLVIFPLMALLNNFPLFVIVSILMGFWFGASWTTSRTLMSNISPKGKHNLAFGYFGLVERVSSFLGPITWGLIVTGMFSFGEIRYRIAVLAITVFIVFGIVALIKVNEKKEKPKHL